MRRFIITPILAICAAFGAQAQTSSTLYSPYVETGTLVINCSGFKPVALRTGSLAKPTPMHANLGAENTTIPTRLLVAKSDLLSTGNWAWANGWTSAVNNGISGGVIASPATGCHAYSESGHPAGSWRVPTQREMLLINLARQELQAQTGLGYLPIGLAFTYWTSSQFNATQGWVLGIYAVDMYIRDKTVSYYVRCVKEL